MCGIWTFINLIKNKQINYNNLFTDFMKLKHRGPDLSVFQMINNNVIVGFHRLAIMDPTFHSNQPYILEDGDRTIVFLCNGEIYNFKELIQNHELDINTNSDCLVIPKLYIKYTKNNCMGPTYINMFTNLFTRDEYNSIKGEFSFVLLEFDKLQNIKHVILGRDEIGVRPLYYNPPTLTTNTLMCASEIKGMSSITEELKEFPPGELLNFYIDNISGIKSLHTYNFKTVYNIKSSELFNNEDFYLEKIRNAVINSIKRRLMSDKPIAFLLSGGVDSSLVAAISAKLLNVPIKTFCCGMSKGTDLLYAKKVADHIGSIHTEVMFTKEEGLKSIEDVIYTTETWDTTTIRASVGQYLVCKHIGEKTDCKVVLVGEGPDEVCSSYLFNYYAPSEKELDNAAKEYVKEIHKYDGRRADRCISKWGLEGRIPFLDPEFIEIYWSIPPQWRHPKYKGIEKWWLRKAFDGLNILPDEVLWRKKEAFSDGVSDKEESWFEIIQNHIKTKLSHFNSNVAPTLEAAYYKEIFVNHFGENRVNILEHYWQPKWINENNSYVDPSARTLNVYT
jgi:asparagine synthase (glutamine-hydrolysing)